MMGRTKAELLVLLVATFATGCTSAPQMPTTVHWDDAAAQEVRVEVETLMNAFAAMDLESFKAGLTVDVVSYETDIEGKPLRLGSRDEVIRWAEETFVELKKMDAALKLDFHKSDCHATATLAYCTIEFDFKATMPNGEMMSQPTRNSVVLRKDEDGWKWTHWHSSPAVSPTAAPSASSTE